MKTIFRNIVSLLGFLIVVSKPLQAQVLSNANLNLLPGEVIHDVVYSPGHQCYIVVGNFTMIGGLYRKNLAFLDATTLQVKTDTVFNPIYAIDGEIWTVDITRTFDVFSGVYVNHLFIGGNFLNLTVHGVTQNRKGIAKLQSTQTVIAPFTNSHFGIHAWNPDLDISIITPTYPTMGVEDILITNDTVIFCGYFTSAEADDSIRSGIAAYGLYGGILDYPIFTQQGPTEHRYYKMIKNGENLFVAGYKTVGDGARLFKLDGNGNLTPGFNSSFTLMSAAYEFEIIEDSVLFVLTDQNSFSGHPSVVTTKKRTNGSSMTHSLNPVSDDYIGSMPVTPYTMDIYRNRIYVMGSGPYFLRAIESNSTGPPVNTTVWTGTLPAPLNPNPHGNLHIAGNKMFISGTNLTSLNGQARTGLGVFCLEPYDAKDFVTYDTTICAGDVRTYAIPMVEFASGYKWEYTGTGALLVGHGMLNAPIEIDMLNAYNRNIEFTDNFSPGQLKITPYSVCNATKIYSNTITLNIVSNPLPHVYAGNDTTITCYNEATGVQLFGYSDSAVVSYEWVYPFGVGNVIGQIDTAVQADDYVFKVVNALGCANFDTVHVAMDTVRPIAILPSPPYTFTCAIPSVELAGSSPTPNTTTEWIWSGNSYANPMMAEVIGSYYFEVTDTLNGCKKDQGLVVSADITPPDVEVVGYPLPNLAIPLDTLTCYDPLLTLSAASLTPNTTVDWVSPDTSVFYGDVLDITTAGQYLIYALNNDNGCTTTMGLMIASNLNEPGVHIPSSASLNCSVDSVLLTGYSLTAGSVLEWATESTTGLSNPIYASFSGWYYATATHPANGCSSTDSIWVDQTNQILVHAGPDLLRCKGDSLILEANYIGIFPGATFNWNTGSTDSTSLFVAGTASYASVVVSGSGCEGRDTVYVDLPPQADVDFEGFKPCGDGASGQIVANPLIGLEPLMYSIDGGTSFQTSTVFGGLSEGTYPIAVKDSLGCRYDFLATIDASSALPTPAFMFSTYNFETDTVVLVDVSNPPTDSTVWVFPSPIVVLDADELSPVILLPDTGTFELTMQAYYGSCMVEVSKTIYASPYDSLMATQYNQNGIKEIILYPNPTGGNFTVEVSFFKAQRAAMVVQDMLGNTYVFEEFDESIFISQPVFLDSGVLDGTYVLKVVSEFDSGSITFILAR